MLDDIVTFFENLLDGAIWKRVGMVIIGGVLICLALSKFTLSDRAAMIAKKVL